MFSLSSVMYSVLVVGCSLALPGAAVDTNLQESTVFGMDDIRTLSVAVAARSILHSLSAVDSRQWLMLLAALALGLTGLSMVLLNERRPRVDGEPILKGSEDGGQVAIAQMAADMAIGEPAEAFGPREGRGTLLGSTLPTRIFYLDRDRRPPCPRTRRRHGVGNHSSKA
jgi:hypothetical protein